jgi:Raf kinase inhibitor-like YbhB/YbcL family protein
VHLGKDATVTVGPAGGTGDPQCTGAGGGGGSVRIVASGGAGDVTIPLACSGWTTNGPNTLYKYKDTTNTTCTKVLVKNGVLVKAICKGSQIAIDLNGSMSPVAVVTTLNSQQYCTEFGGNLVHDGSDDKTFLRKDAPAPSACGGGGTGPAEFEVTSPTITEGGAIPTTHVCSAKGGMNQSPQLAWVNPPAGTMSFAMVLTDESNGLVHSAFYDIPSTLTGLPANVERVYAPPSVAGMHTTNAYDNARGWAGPCPPTGTHTYEIAIYALDVATLPGATMATSKDQVATAVIADNLGVATLTATFTAP